MKLEVLESNLLFLGGEGILLNTISHPKTCDLGDWRTIFNGFCH